jgi:hypothetical protein
MTGMNVWLKLKWPNKFMAVSAEHTMLPNRRPVKGQWHESVFAHHLREAGLFATGVGLYPCQCYELP